jgi:hypothetical protein
MELSGTIKAARASASTAARLRKIAGGARWHSAC